MAENNSVVNSYYFTFGLSGVFPQLEKIKYLLTAHIILISYISKIVNI